MWTLTLNNKKIKKYTFFNSFREETKIEIGSDVRRMCRFWAKWRVSRKTPFTTLHALFIFLSSSFIFGLKSIAERALIGSDKWI